VDRKVLIEEEPHPNPGDGSLVYHAGQPQKTLGGSPESEIAWKLRFARPPAHEGRSRRQRRYYSWSWDEERPASIRISIKDFLVGSRGRTKKRGLDATPLFILAIKCLRGLNLKGKVPPRGRFLEQRGFSRARKLL